jgi:UDP-N-acetylmuramyl pentapeptide synthase
MASLASIRQADRVAILEGAGTHPGRLAARSGYVKPHLFVLTEVGNEHINFHGSQQAVIESKADIALGLVEGGFGILNADSRNYVATRRAVLARKRVPLCLFGSASHCNGRLLSSEFQNNVWTVAADIEGQRVQYRLPLLGDHAPLASVSVLLAAYYLGADVSQAAAEFQSFRPYESQGVLRQLAHRGGVITCYDNASRASVLSYQSTLGMAARLTPPAVNGKKVAVIGQMIFLGEASEAGHAQLAPWIDAAGFDRIILVGQYTDVTFAHLKNPGAVVARFSTYDRRTSGKSELQALIDATEAACDPGDLLFIKGEVDELGEYLRAKQLPADRGHGAPATSGSPPTIQVRSPPTSVLPAVPSQGPDLSVLQGLRALDLSDLPRYRRAIDATQRTTWQHYFALIYLLGRSPGYRFLVEEDAGSFCLYLLRVKKSEQSLSLFLLPMPAEPAVIERCIARIRAFNQSARASLFRVDEADAALFSGRPNTRIVRCPPDYIYAPATYLNLSGNKNGNLRRAIGSIAKRPDLEVLDYQSADAAQCKQLLDQWAELQREKYGAVLYGSYTRDCLDMYDDFPRQDLFGKVIKLDGAICAFGFGGAMRQGMGNLFIAYSDLRIDGLNRFLWVHLLRDMESLALVNGGNAGDTPGLAFAKQSLRPVSLFQPCQVYAG